jgi:DNA polymerase-3 subunit delta'
MASILETELPDATQEQRRRLVELAGGSAGRALALAGLDLAPLEQVATAILREGDPSNERRSKLAAELGRKGAGDRYEAFLDLVPAIVAREARSLSGAPQKRAADAYARARELASLAPRHSLDPAATIFQLGGILASVAAAPFLEGQKREG